MGATPWRFKSSQPHHFPRGGATDVAFLVRVAVVAELVDALDSGSSGGNPVEVRVLSTAPALLPSKLILDNFSHEFIVIYSAAASVRGCRFSTKVAQ